MEKSVKNCALNSNNNKALRRCNYDTKQQQLLDLSWVELEQVIYLLNVKFADKNKAANHVSIVMFLMNVECSAFFWCLIWYCTAEYFHSDSADELHCNSIFRSILNLFCFFFSSCSLSHHATQKSMIYIVLIIRYTAI